MTVAREVFDLRIGGAYLPSLLIFTIPHNNEYILSVGAFSLIGAIYFHGISRHVFGIGGPEENPLEFDEFVDRYQQVVLSDLEGDMPTSNYGLVKRLWTSAPTLGKKAFIAIGIVSIVIWLPSVLISLYFAFSNYNSANIGLKILIFAELVWIIQWMVWRFFEEADMEESEPS